MAHQLFALLIPLMGIPKINVGGELYGQDILALLILPYLLLRPGARARLGSAKWFFVFVFLWLIGQITTDLIRDTPIGDYSRGWSRIGFFTIQFTFLWLLLRNWRVFMLYFAGTALWAFILARNLPPEYAEAGNDWKFGLGFALIFGAAAVGNLVQSRVQARWAYWLPAILIAAAGLLALLHNARNIFGTAALSSLYLLLAGLIATRPKLSRQLTPGKFVLIAISGLIASEGLLAGYGAVAQAGLIGPDAKAKYEQQTAGDLSLLQGGRTESIISMVAIGDSPILGHGSWARGIEYVRLFSYKLLRAGVGQKVKDSAEREGDLIPLHSHLLGAWVEAGITGAIFWIWALIITGLALYPLLRLRNVPTAIAVVSAFSMFWDVLFSPFGAQERFVRAGQLTLLMQVLVTARRRNAPLRLIVQPSPAFPNGGVLTMGRPVGPGRLRGREPAL